MMPYSYKRYDISGASQRCQFASHFEYPEAREMAGTGAEAGVRDGMVGLGWWEVKNSSDDLEYKLVLF